MQNTKWKDRIYVALDEIREDSITPLREKSSYYQKYSAEEHKAHKKLEKLKLSRKERLVIDRVLDAQSATDGEYSMLSYLAGILDCLRFIDYIRELKES